MSDPSPERTKAERWMGDPLERFGLEVGATYPSSDGDFQNMVAVAEVRAAIAAERSAMASERAAAAAHDTAVWTRWLAFATFALALATVIATIVTAGS